MFTSKHDKTKWFTSTWYRMMLNVLLLVSVLAYLASYLTDDTNDQQQRTHHQYNDELDLGDDLTDQIEILDTENKVNCKQSNTPQVVCNSQLYNEFVLYGTIDTNNLQAIDQIITNKLSITVDHSDITNSDNINTESILADKIQKNLQSYYPNSFIKLYPEGGVTLSSQVTLISLATRLDSLNIDHLQYTASTPQQDQSEPQYNESLTEQDKQHEKLIRVIISGSVVSILWWM